MAKPKRRFPLGRLLSVLGTGACVALLAYVLGPRPVEVEVATVTRGRLTVTVDEDGRTRVRERYVVSSPLAGRLLRVELHAGDKVEAGKTVVAAIEPKAPELLDVRAEAEAQARVRAAEAALNRAEPDLSRCRAEWEYARDEDRRLRPMFERGAASDNELQRAVLAERVARQQLKGAEFALEIARFELAQAQAALLQTRQSTDGSAALSRFEIPAPCDGRVLRVLQESSAVVSAGTPLLEVGDPTDLEVVVDVLSSEGARIKPGAAVTLEHWADPDAEPLHAVVRLVEPSAFLKISALGVEEQRVNVIADLTDPPAKRASLGDGFRVDAKIVVWDDDDVLRVPSAALFRRGENWAAFVVDDRGNAQERSIRLGHASALEAEVVGGLAAGERVILHPGDAIRPGIAVSAR